MLKGLFLKEFVLLLVVVGAGAGFVSFLPRQFGPLARLALAPAFGLAASIAVLTTVNFFTPLRDALWFVLVPGVALSLSVALARCLRSADGADGPDGANGADGTDGTDGAQPARRLNPARILRAAPPIGHLAQLGAVLVVVLTAYNLPLDQRLSPGPISYAIADAPGYVACIRGFGEHRTNQPLGQDYDTAFNLRQDAGDFGPAWNLTLKYCDTFKFQHTASMVVPAAVGAGLGWPSWQMLAPFIALLAAIAALGAFAMVVTFAHAGPIAMGAGVLAAGAPSFQLAIDGSAGLLSGLALLPAVALVGWVAISRPQWKLVVLVAVLGAGLQASYPEIGAVVIGAAVIVLGGRLVVHMRRGGTFAGALRAYGPMLLATGALTLLLAPRATLWSVANFTFSRGAYTADSLPDFNMQPEFMIGWLLQTREFFSFATVTPTGVEFVVIGVLLPIVLVLVAVYGAIRVPGVRIVLAIALTAVAQSLYLNTTSGCTYCVDRTMLAVAPLVFVAVGIGLLELRRATRWGGRELSGALAGIALLCAGSSLLALEQRAQRGGYMPAPDLVGMVNRVEAVVDGTLQLQGFTETPLWSWSDTPIVYDAMQEATRRRVSLVSAYSDYGGLTYRRTRPVGHPSYTPDYQYVLNRMTGLDSGRDVVSQTTSMKLERRAGEFDTVVARGVAVDTYQRDPVGTAWVQAPGRQLGLEQGPLTFWTSATSERPAYVRVTIAAGPAVRPQAGQPGVTKRLRPDGRHEFCVPVPGREPARIATLALEGLPATVTPPPAGPYQQPPDFADGAPDQLAALAAQGVKLDAVLTSATPCRRS